MSVNTQELGGVAAEDPGLVHARESSESGHHLHRTVDAEIETVIAAEHHPVGADMPDPEAHTKRSRVFTALYRDVLTAQRTALIGERDAGRIEDEAVRAMLERLDLQEAGVSSRLESRF